MKVFVTGAGGYIGKAVVQELLQHGHEVIGLARSDHSAEVIKQAGGEVQRGDIEDVETLKAGARAADGVVHLAFMVDNFDFDKALAVDRAAIEALANGLAENGNGKPLVAASGTLFLPPRQLSTEDTPVEQGNIFSERGISDELVRKFSKEKGVRGSVLRLSPVVHSSEDKFFVVWMIANAKKYGHVTLTREDTRWPSVHRSDAATLFRLALEKGQAGATYNVVAEQGVAIKDIAEAISKHVNVPVKLMSMDEAAKEIGFMANVVSRDCYVSSDKTQRDLGWKPSQPGLLADMEANYFS